MTYARLVNRARSAEDEMITAAEIRNEMEANSIPHNAVKGLRHGAESNKSGEHRLIEGWATKRIA